MSEVPAPQPGDHLRRLLERLRAKRGDAPPSMYELAVEKGAAGEYEFGSVLNDAAARRGGCWVLHGLVLEGKRADIDHVVVGPAGVIAIDSKTWTGRVWVGRAGLGRGRRASPKEIDGMSRQINRVHSRLATVGRDDVPVAGVLCLVNRNKGIPAAGLSEIRGIKLGHPNAVLHHVLRDGPFAEEAVGAAARILRDAFLVTGGVQEPTPRVRPIAAKRKRRLRAPLFARRLALLVLSAMLALTGVALIVSTLDGATDRLTQPYHAYARADLVSHEPMLRRIAIKRAQGRVRGPTIRASSKEFTLIYRRANRCRVVVRVSRAVRIAGGGKVTRVRSSGCGRRP